MLHWPDPIGFREHHYSEVPRIALQVLADWKRAVAHRGAIIVSYNYNGALYVSVDNNLPIPIYYAPTHIIDTTEEDVERWQRIKACSTYQKIELGFYDGKHFRG